MDAVNAVLECGALCAGWDEEVTDSGEDRDEALKAASFIEGGTEISTYPAECRITIERRVVPGETSHKILADLTLKWRWQSVRICSRRWIMLVGHRARGTTALRPHFGR